MTGSSHDASDHIDRKTSWSICEAVGERLRYDLKPEALASSVHLDQLVDEIRRREISTRC